LNLMVLKRRENGRAEGTPILFALNLRGNPEIRARLRALFFRKGGGSTSEAIATKYLL